VQARGRQLAAGFERWQQAPGHPSAISRLPYIMLHSFAHLLITAVSLGVGIRVRSANVSTPYQVWAMACSSIPGLQCRRHAGRPDSGRSTPP
jgi:hypothetical protein